MKGLRLALLPTIALLTGALAACGSGVSDEDGKAFVEHVREFIPSTAAYDDESLIDMAEHVCQLGNEEDGVRILDNYRDLEAEDYSAFAISALTYACPDES